MLDFCPAIVRDQTIIELPRPVLVCRIHDGWDFLTLKVPLRDGDEVSGPSRDGVEITVEGQIGSQSGELKLSAEAMLNALLTLRAALNVSADETFWLSLFQDEAGTTFRYFKECRASRFDIDFSDHRIYSYAASIHASDPVLYEGVLP